MPSNLFFFLAKAVKKMYGKKSIQYLKLKRKVHTYLYVGLLM